MVRSDACSGHVASAAATAASVAAGVRPLYVLWATWLLYAQYSRRSSVKRSGLKSKIKQGRVLVQTLNETLHVSVQRA